MPPAAASARALLDRLLTHVEKDSGRSGEAAFLKDDERGARVSWGERVAVLKAVSTVRWVVLAAGGGVDAVGEVVWLQQRAVQVALGEISRPLTLALMLQASLARGGRALLCACLCSSSSSSSRAAVGCPHA